MSGNCPICGKETEGIHIAGTVYDFQCDDCVAETDAYFAQFIDRLIEDTAGGTTTTGDQTA